MFVTVIFYQTFCVYRWWSFGFVASLLDHFTLLREIENALQLVTKLHLG